MKYKVGDKVRTKEGYIMTIASVNHNCFFPYWMKEDCGAVAWSVDMIAGLADEPQNDTDDAEPEQSLEELKKENMDLIRQNYDKAAEISDLKHKCSDLKHRNNGLEERTREHDKSSRRLNRRITELETQNKEFLEIIKNFSKAGIER